MKKVIILIFFLILFSSCTKKQEKWISCYEIHEYNIKNDLVAIDTLFDVDYVNYIKYKEDEYGTMIENNGMLKNSCESITYYVIQPNNRIEYKKFRMLNPNYISETKVEENIIYNNLTFMDWLKLCAICSFCFGIGITFGFKYLVKLIKK